MQLLFPFQVPLFRWDMVWYGLCIRTIIVVMGHFDVPPHLPALWKVDPCRDMLGASRIFPVTPTRHSSGALCWSGRIDMHGHTLICRGSKPRWSHRPMTLSRCLWALLLASSQVHFLQRLSIEQHRESLSAWILDVIRILVPCVCDLWPLCQPEQRFLWTLNSSGVRADVYSVHPSKSSAL